MFCKGYPNLGSKSLNNMFTPYTRHKNLCPKEELLVSPNKSKTHMGGTNIKVRRCSYWNLLPVDIKAISINDSFKKAPKQLKVEEVILGLNYFSQSDLPLK